MTTASVQDIGIDRVTGVGGDNRWACEQSGPPDRLTQAELDLSRWKSRRHSAGSRWAASFPYDSAIGYLRSAGRNRADARLVRDLRKVHLSLITDRAGGRSTADGDLLASWLPMTFDAGDGTYDSYIGAAILEALPGRLERAHATGEVIDTVAAAVLADLVLTEADALDAGPAGKRQTARLRAAVQALCGTASFAPDAVTRVDPGLEVPAEAGALIATAVDLATGVLDAVPDLVRRSVALTLLPTTTVHDELMFIRGIQAFECVYQQVARSTEIAIDEIRGGDPAAAVAELGRATARLAATPILYRLVTTMPKESFAVIRDATDGRSAIQSRPYNRVEQLCARAADLSDVHCRPADQTGGRPTLEEVLAERRDAVGPVMADRLGAAMQELDEAWRSMKRTHWGVALKIIGRVPGTGGTAGADYLEVKSTQPLFPHLTAPHLTTPHLKAPHLTTPNLTTLETP